MLILQHFLQNLPRLENYFFCQIEQFLNAGFAKISDDVVNLIKNTKTTETKEISKVFHNYFEDLKQKNWEKLVYKKMFYLFQIKNDNVKKSLILNH
jgi:hypothetical protein